MNRLLLVFVVCGAVLFAGCNTLVDTHQERNRRITHLSDLQMRMFVEDLDYLLLLERSSALTQWHPHVGI